MPTYEFKSAFADIENASIAIDKLVENEGDPDVLDRYSKAQDALHAELDALIEEKLEKSSKDYATRTAEIRGAKDELDEAAERANQLAAKLNIGATALGALTRIAGAVA